MAPASRTCPLTLLLAFFLLSITRAADLSTDRCTDLSLRNPSWQISDFKLGTSDSPNGLSFLLQSNATGYTTRCSSVTERNTCESAALPDRDDIKTSFRWSVEPDNNIKLHLDQTWNCSDVSPNRSITFNAVANVTVARDCSPSGSDINMICQKSGPGTVFGSLLSPVRIDFSPPTSKPSNMDTPGCLAASPKSSWTVSNFRYDASYQGIITFGSIPFYTGYMGFNLTNPANNYTVTCSITDADLGYFLANSTIGLKWADCDRTPRDPSRERAEYKIVTRVLFNQLDKTFSVDQVWFCEKNGNPGETRPSVAPVMFQGIGTAEMPLDCVRTGTGSLMTARMSMTCTAPEFTVASNNTTQTDLAANALSHSRLDTPSCTASSFHFPGWTLHDFSYRLDSSIYTNQPPDYKSSYWGFELYVAQATETINYNCDGWRVLTNTDVNACYPWPWRMKPEDEYIKGINVTYQYDVKSYRIAITTTWSCRDLDASHPITFKATGSATLPMNCTDHPECLGKGTDDCGLVQCQKLGRAVIPVDSLSYQQ